MNIHSVTGQWIDLKDIAPKELRYFDVYSLVFGRVTDVFWNGEKFMGHHGCYRHQYGPIPDVTHYMRIDPPFTNEERSE